MFTATQIELVIFNLGVTLVQSVVINKANIVYNALDRCKSLNKHLIKINQWRL